MPLFPRHKKKGIGLPVSPRSRSRHRTQRTYKVEDTPQVFIEIDVLRLAKTVVVVHFVPGFYSLLEFLCPDGPWQQLME